MEKKELTLLELKNIVEEFKIHETNEEIFWGQSSNYKLYKTIFEGDEVKELKRNIIDTIEFALENRAISNYDLECSFDETIEVFPSEKVENYILINSRILEEDINNIGIETKLENFNFIIFRITILSGNENKEITIIKRFVKPQTTLRQAMKLLWIGDRMKKVEEDVIYLDNQVDAFEYGGNFFILNRDKFNSIFKFKDMYCKLIDKETDYIKETNFIDNPEEFINKCKENGHYVKRISKAIIRKGFENIEKNKDRVKDVIEKHKLGIKIDQEGRIVYEENKIGNILNLLLDYCVISELSDKRAIARALDFEGEE